MSKFHDVLKSLRISYNLTQDDLAKQLQISRSTIGMYEKGAREPDFDALELIADFFNVDTDYLLGRTSKMISTNQATLSEQIVSSYGQALYDHVEVFSKLSVSNQAKAAAYAAGLFSIQQMEDELLAFQNRSKFLHNS